MKIRIKGNSVRMRLSKDDVRELENRGHVLETTQFPNGDFFDYSIVMEPVTYMRAFVLENGIQVVLPEEAARTWAGSDQVGIDMALELPAGGQLAVLVEKDFTCLAERGEDESNLYPNPRAAHA